MAVILHKLSATAMTISTEERDFFVALGERIASLRKVHSILTTDKRQVLQLIDAFIERGQFNRHAQTASAR